jgi:hypothetical protein
MAGRTKAWTLIQVEPQKDDNGDIITIQFTSSGSGKVISILTVSDAIYVTVTEDGGRRALSVFPESPSTIQIM